MILWRIENGQGRGPYSSAYARAYDHAFPDVGDVPPCFDNSGSWRSGCTSWMDLAGMFDPARRRWLERHGFNVVTYCSDHVRECAGPQVLFIPRDGSRDVVPWRDCDV